MFGLQRTEMANGELKQMTLLNNLIRNKNVVRWV